MAVKRAATVLYLPGCETIATAPDAAVGFLRATSLLGLTEVGVTRASSACCGLPLFWAGELDGFKGHAARFASQLEGAERIVVHDPACGHAIVKRYADVGVSVKAPVEHITTYLYRHLHLGRPDKAAGDPRTAYADACGLVRGLGETDAPRRLLRHALGRKAEELADVTNPADTDCCGAAGLLPLAAPHTATAMAEARIEAFRETGAERLALSSPRCAAHLRSVDPMLDVVDIASYLARL
jgi:Fe-S oxidoreductase